jgi:hypothetical protein
MLGIYWAAEDRFSSSVEYSPSACAGAARCCWVLLPIRFPRTVSSSLPSPAALCPLADEVSCRTKLSTAGVQIRDVEEGVQKHLEVILKTLLLAFMTTKRA